jgi:hypothetical protein
MVEGDFARSQKGARAMNRRFASYSSPGNPVRRDSSQTLIEGRWHARARPRTVVESM